MGLTIEVFRGAELRARLDALAFLRIAVFEDYPYLYCGDIAYEHAYLKSFSGADGAVLVGACAEDRLIGAATAAPLSQYNAAWHAMFKKRGLGDHTIFYFGESVLLSEYRQRGIGHLFFDEREALARQAGATMATFLSVMRPPDHPACPSDYFAPEEFWRRRGFLPFDGLTTTLDWEEHGSDGEIPHDMQFWVKPL